MTRRGGSGDSAAGTGHGPIGTSIAEPVDRSPSGAGRRRAATTGPRPRRRRAARRRAAAARPSTRPSTPARRRRRRVTPATARAGLERQLVVPGHDRRPAALDQPADVVERRGHGEPRRSGRACPASRTRSGTGPLPRAPRRVRAVGDRRRPDAGLAVAPDVEERRALRRADPLVEVRRVVRRARARRGRAAPSPARAPRRRACRSRGRRARATIRSIGRTSAVGLVTWLTIASRVRSVAAAEDPLDDVVLRGGREREPGDDDARAVARGDVAGDVEDRVVLVVGREDLVAGLEPERADDRVHAAGRVRDQPQVVRVGADERPDRPAHLGEVAVELAGRGTGPAARSSRSRHSRWTARTSVGQAPNEPWLRNVTSGSSAQWRASGRRHRPNDGG